MPALPRTLPFFGSSLTYMADPLTFMAEQYRRHGPVSEATFLGERWTVLLGPDACSHALRNPDKAFANGPGWGRLVGPFFDGGLMLLDFEEHHRHRRLMQQAFTRDHLDGYTAALGPAAAGGLAGWRPADDFLAYPALKQLTLDLATQVFMGGAQLTSARELDDVNRAFVACVQAATAFVRAPLPGSRWGRGVRGRALLESFLRRHLPAKRASDGDDLFSVLCRLSDDGDSFSDTDVVNHMVFLLMAAHDTSTITVSTALQHLGQHPEWQDRLREHARSAPEHPTLTELDAWHDADLVVSECLRLLPPVPVLARRTVKESEVMGVPVPADRLTAVMVHLQHHQAEWWSEPERFDPERFAEPRREDRATRHAFEPFGGGVHKCLGMFFAGAEVKLVLHHLLRRFRWEVEPGYRPALSYISLPVPRDGLPVRLRTLT